MPPSSYKRSVGRGAIRLPAADAKVPTNVSIRESLVARARSHGINLSELLETALVRELRDREQRAWQEENREAIDDYNAQVAKRGVFSDDWRRF